MKTLETSTLFSLRLNLALGEQSILREDQMVSHNLMYVCTAQMLVKHWTHRLHSAIPGEIIMAADLPHVVLPGIRGVIVESQACID